MKLNKRGMSLIEMLVSIILTGMILVFLFVILFVFSTIIFLIITGTIEYRVDKLLISNMNTKEKTTIDFLSYFEFYVFSKFRIIKVKIDDETIKKLSLNDKFKNIDFNKLKTDKPLKKENRELLKKMHINLKQFHFNLELGTKSVITSSFLITIISTLLPMFLSKIIQKYDKNDYSFNIKPVYIGENKLKLEFNGIVSVKMVHIIYVIYIYLKEKGEWKNNERTSNRRSYGYSYE